MYSKNGNIEILIGSETDEIIEKSFETIKARENTKNDNGKCFQYAITVSLNHEQIKKDPQKITTIKSFIDQYNWKEIDFPSNKRDWKTFELNNQSIALNIFYVPIIQKK